MRPTFDQVLVGDHLPPYSYTVSRADLVRYCGASGDFNPIHWSESTAKAAGLPNVISHGMLTMAKSVNGVVAWLEDPARVVEYGVRFVRPVVVPDATPSDTVTIDAEVTEKLDGDRVRVSLTVTCGGDAVLGRAEVVAQL
jgi:acyl dehydratase